MILVGFEGVSFDSEGAMVGEHRAGGFDPARVRLGVQPEWYHVSVIARNSARFLELGGFPFVAGSGAS